MTMYYDKTGRPMLLEEWGKKLGDIDYKVIEQTTLQNGKWVSTVWLGLDHRFSDSGEPLIFETMVFPEQGNYAEEFCERYSTLEEAQAGHKRICEEYDK